MFKKRFKKFTIIALTLVLFSSTVFAAGVSFKDVKSTHWAYDTILWAEKEGIIKGYIDGIFKPNNNVTEAEFLAMLLRAYGVDTSVTDGHWADKAYEVAEEMNYPNTGASDLNSRNKVITRTHVAEIIAGTQGVNYTGDLAIRYLLGAGISNGKTAPTVEGYQGADGLTRAEAVAFIKKAMDNGISDELLVRPDKPSDPALLPTLPQTYDTFDIKTYMDTVIGNLEAEGYKVRYSIVVIDEELEKQGLKSVVMVTDWKTKSSLATIFEGGYEDYDWSKAEYEGASITIDTWYPKEGVLEELPSGGFWQSSYIDYNISSEGSKELSFFSQITLDFIEFEPMPESERFFEIVMESFGLPVPDDYAEQFRELSRNDVDETFDTWGNYDIFIHWEGLDMGWMVTMYDME